MSTPAPATTIQSATHVHSGRRRNRNFTWLWATEEQRDWFAETAPHYVSAMLLGGEEGFWESVREQWFRRWPIAPQLVERGLLPPGVLQEGHVLTETEAEMVNIKEWEHMKRIRITLFWLRAQKSIQEEADAIGFEG